MKYLFYVKSRIDIWESQWAFLSMFHSSWPTLLCSETAQKLKNLHHLLNEKKPGAQYPFVSGFFCMKLG